MLENITILLNNTHFQKMWNNDEPYLLQHFPRADNPEEIDHSCVEASLCDHLSIVTNNDAAQIEHIMSQRPNIRDKWLNNHDYRNFTIGRAVQLC